MFKYWKENKERIKANFSIALEAVLGNQVRSLLTALGIIFGVAAVIAMLAIGNGAQQDILEQIKLVGVNNIIINPVVEQIDEQVDQNDKEKKKFSPGLRMLDVEAIADIVPGIEKISPEIIQDTYIIKDGFRRSAKLVGVEPAYFEVTAFELSEGKMFTEDQMTNGKPVCIIGKSIRTRFFQRENPIGKRIKVGNQWLEVVGVLEERLVSEKALSNANLGVRDFNMDVYVPIQTALVRYRNRAKITSAQLGLGGGPSNATGGWFRFMAGGSEETPAPAPTGPVNYHQIDKLTVQVQESELLGSTADVISRMLQRRHYGVVDFEVTIPELLLKQQQRTQQIFNIVLGAIAGISLLVGGIGIMNIMLASVLERIKEIGLRLSLGAQKSDIIFQFLFEAVMISITGGLVGVAIGIFLAFLVSTFGDFPTVVSFSSVFISFGVAATVGLIFGIAPARRAANQDPITSLRHD